MKFVWVDAGNDADWAKLARNGITGAFYALSDPPADLRRRLADTKARGLQAGLYSAWNWWPESDGDTAVHGRRYAELADERVKEVCRGLAGASNSYPKVQLDNEEHSEACILAMLRRHRELQPKRDTSWTFEYHQGGWMGAAFVAEVQSHRVRLVPQGYHGTMARIELRDSDPAQFLRELIATVVDTRANVDDLTARGFTSAVISPFYDGAFLPVDWDGFAFTMGRLP